MAVDQDGFPLQQRGEQERPQFLGAPPSYQTYKTSDTDAQRQSHDDSIHPASLAYPPPAPPLTTFSSTNQLISPDTVGPDAPLLRRLSQRLSILSPAGAGAEYKTYEQLAEEDRTLDAEEKAMLKRGMFNWSEMKNWRFWIRKEWWGAFCVLPVLPFLFGLWQGRLLVVH
jgi:hypothetical protein